MQWKLQKRLVETALFLSTLSRLVSQQEQKGLQKTKLYTKQWRQNVTTM